MLSRRQSSDRDDRNETEAGFWWRAVSSGSCRESFKELPEVDLNNSSEPSSAVALLAAPP
jgi:hypothetical protein